MSDLLNTTLAALASPRKGIRNYISHSYSEASRRRCQQGLVGAQKFTLCDSLLEHCVVASFVKPRALLDMCELAIPPFHNMWIEWDEQKRMKMLIHHGTKFGIYDKNTKWAPEGWGEKVGYHIWDDPPEKHFCYSQYTLEPKEQQILVPPMSITLRNDEKLNPKITLASEHTYNSETHYEKTMRKQQLQFGHVLIGSHYHEVWKLTNDNKNALEELYYRMNISLSNAGNMILPKHIANDNRVHTNIANDAVMHHAGDLRFLITALAILNYPHTVKERKLEQSPKRIMYGRNVPRNELRVVEIDLPKPRGTTRYERMFKGGGGQKRRHVRRGHWHTYIYKGGVRKTKWLGERWCGNAELGTITHDYELKNKRTK